jgi:NAD+ diphosphatase
VSDPPLPYTAVALDRAQPLRAHAERLAELVTDPAAVGIAATAGGVLARDGGAGPELVRVPLAGGGARLLDPEQPLLLGVEAGAPLFAIDLERLEPSLRAELEDGSRLMPLREAGLMLPQADGGLAAYVAALLNWHRRHGFCPNCGTPTRVTEAGLARHCDNCGLNHFPRVDPVVIMLVEHGDEILMGSRTGWPENRYSVLAGFVSPGETPEDAVIREVAEESGIEVYDPVYVAAQPWPFPSSLMLGFNARSDGGTPRPDPDELAAVRWFSLEEVQAAEREEADFHLPGEVSIARALIDRWVERRSGGTGRR